MSLSLKAMTYYNAALRHGNIARAAVELNIAASAVSSAIDQVEATFELQLITRRRSRGIEATASGRRIAEQFNRLLEEYRAVLSHGADLKQALKGELRIGYYAPVAPAFLPRILESALPVTNNVVLHFEEGDNDAVQDGFLNGSYDVILFVSEGARPALEFDSLIEAPPFCLVDRSHRFFGRSAVSIRELAGEPMVILDRPVASSYYQRLLEICEGDITIAATADSTEMVRSLVGAGRGCAILNMNPLTAASYAGHDLAAIALSDDLPPLTLSIAYHKNRPRRMVETFVAACHDHFRSDGPHQCIVRQPARV